MEGEERTSDRASRSFCAECSFVEPFGLSIDFVSVLCRAANLGFVCRTWSSIGGSILVIVVEGNGGGGVVQTRLLFTKCGAARLRCARASASCFREEQSRHGVCVRCDVVFDASLRAEMNALSTHRNSVSCKFSFNHIYVYIADYQRISSSTWTTLLGK